MVNYCDNWEYCCYVDCLVMLEVQSVIDGCDWFKKCYQGFKKGFFKLWVY